MLSLFSKLQEPTKWIQNTLSFHGDESCIFVNLELLSKKQDRKCNIPVGLSGQNSDRHHRIPFLILIRYALMNLNTVSPIFASQSVSLVPAHPRESQGAGELRALDTAGRPHSLPPSATRFLLTSHLHPPPTSLKPTHFKET